MKKKERNNNKITEVWSRISSCVVLEEKDCVRVLHNRVESDINWNWIRLFFLHLLCERSEWEFVSGTGFVRTPFVSSMYVFRYKLLLKLVLVSPRVENHFLFNPPQIPSKYITASGTGIVLKLTDYEILSRTHTHTYPRTNTQYTSIIKKRKKKSLVRDEKNRLFYTFFSNQGAWCTPPSPNHLLPYTHINTQTFGVVVIVVQQGTTWFHCVYYTDTLLI